MRQLILFAVTSGLVLLFANPQFPKLVDSIAGSPLSKHTFAIVCAILAGIFICLIDTTFPAKCRENFTFTEQRYSTTPQNQYVAMDDYYGNQFFVVPEDVNRINQPRFDHFSKYFIGRNEGALRKYSSAKDKPAACAYVSAGGVLESPAETVFRGKPLSYYQTLSENAGMPLWKTAWKVGN